MTFSLICRRHLAWFTLLCVFVVTLNVQAQQQITQSVVAGGGGSSTGGAFRVDGTAGQGVTGAISGGAFSLSSGFWAGAAGGTFNTTAVVSSSLNPSISGQGVIFTIVLSPVASVIIPTGTVQFKDNGANLGAGIVLSAGAGNSATASTPSITSLTVGNHTITVDYSGDGNFAASNANPMTGNPQVVNPVPSFSINNASLVKPASGTGTMLFTVSLATPAVTLTTVHYATSDGSAVAGTDYVSAPDTLLSFSAGDQVKTIPVTINGGSAVSNKTFTVTLSNPSAGATIANATGTGTIRATRTPSKALISELRSSGPAGPGDDFVEVYNNTDVPLSVTDTNGGTGWAIAKSTSGCGNPQVIGVIPNGTLIPARGHFLLAGSAYSLGGVNGYPAGSGSAVANQTLVSDIENDANIGLFSTANLTAISTANRLDAVGFGGNTGGTCDLLREGGTLPPAGGSTSQYSFVRIPTPGTSQDTDNNAVDFLLVSTTPFTAVGSNLTPTLGAPGPENSFSPTLFSGLTSGVIDPSVVATAAPNRVRNTSPYTDTLSGTSPGPAAGPYTLGTLVIRRSYLNSTGAPVTRLRFRLIDMTGYPAAAGVADLRGLTSPASQSVTITGGGSVTVIGTSLEGVSTPAPSQPFGGGINSTMTVSLPTPLANGNSINVQWMLGVKQAGTFRFFVLIEGL